MFGAGNGGGLVFDWLTAHSIKVTAFCESAAFWREGKTFLEKPVYNCETLSEHFDKCNLVFAASGDGVRDIWDNPSAVVNKKYYFNVFTPVIGDFKLTFEQVNAHIDKLDDTYQMLADEKSKQVFLSYVEERAHCFKIHVPHLFEQTTFDEYFNELYDLSGREHHNLIDCGAYIGDSAEQFFNFIREHGKTGKVFAFKPEENNFRRLKKASDEMKAAGLGEVECFPYGVGDKKEIISFVGERGISSHRVDDDSTEENIVHLQVVRLDDMLKDVEISAIKMDIEGSELSALKGAASIISEQMPFPAICVYHRDDDLIKIPQYIRQLCKQYKFYLRHHMFHMYDTVLYAVP